MVLLRITWCDLTVGWYFLSIYIIFLIFWKRFIYYFRERISTLGVENFWGSFWFDKGFHIPCKENISHWNQGKKSTLPNYAPRESEPTQSCNGTQSCVCDRDDNPMGKVVVPKYPRHPYTNHLTIPKLRKLHILHHKGAIVSIINQSLGEDVWQVPNGT